MDQDFEQLSRDFGGTFRFTTALIRRARELAGGSPKLIESDLKDPTEIALEEFATGKISISTVPMVEKEIKSE